MTLKIRDCKDRLISLIVKRLTEKFRTCFWADGYIILHSRIWISGLIGFNFEFEVIDKRITIKFSSINYYKPRVLY